MRKTWVTLPIILFFVLACDPSDDFQASSKRLDIEMVSGDSTVAKMEKQESEPISNEPILVSDESTSINEEIKQCTEKPDLSTKGIKVVNRDVFANGMLDVFNLDLRTFVKSLPAPQGKVKYQSTRLRGAISSSFIQELLGKANPIARALVANIKDGSFESSEVAAKLLAEMLGRLYRVSPESALVQSQLVLFQTVLKDNGGKVEHAFITALEAAIQTPAFVYRLPSKEGIGAYEKAARLAELIWRSFPDETLLQKAKQGALGDSEKLRAEVARMLADPKSKRGVKAFFSQWLSLNNAFNAQRWYFSNKDKSDIIRKSLDKLLLDIERHTFTTQKPIPAIFNEFPGELDPSFASLIPLDRLQRKNSTTNPGLLSHPLLNLAQSQADHPSLVGRGLYVLRTYLCLDVGAPPPLGGAVDEEALPEGASERQVLEAHRKKPSCAGCHDLMDPPAIALLPLDASGLVREMDSKGKAIDSKVDFQLDGAKKVVAGPTEMQQLFSGSKDVRMCLLKQGLEYATGVKPDRKYSCLIEQMETAFSQTKQDYTSLIMTLVNAEVFWQ